MATQPDIDDDFEEDTPDLNLDDDDEDQQPDDDGDDGGPADAEPDEEVDVIGWGADPIAADDEPEGMRNLRNRLREVEKEKRELERRVAPQVEEIGEKPNFDDYFDKPEDFERDLLAWNDRQKAARARQEQQEAAQAKQQERWQVQSRKLDDGYADLRAPGKDTARATVEEQFPGELFGFLVKAAGDSAPGFIFALGNSEAKRKELKDLAAEGSYAEFIAAAAIMSKEVSVQRRKPAVGAETNHSNSGTSGGTGRGDQRHARLVAEAEKTGDYSALVRYEAQKGRK